MDFVSHYRASWLGAAVLGALSCCNGDTWASELGSVWSDKSPWLVTRGEGVSTLDLRMISAKIKRP